jgi:hypothetical protein
MSTPMVGVARERHVGVFGLVLGPVLLGLGLAIWTELIHLDQVLPLSRAWIGGAIALPMVIVSPGLISLAWADASTEPAARWLARALAVAIALGVVGLLALTVRQIGCQPVTDPLQILPRGAICGGISGVGYLASIGAGRSYASSERPLRAVVASSSTALGVLVAVVLAFSVLFPAALCAPAPS